MAEKIYKSKQYRLRAGSPMPVQDSGRFIMHTFMAEVNDIDIVSCTTRLPASEEFRGQGGNMISANFTRLNTKGGEVFSGKIVYAPEFVDEDNI